jgi:hypothetical protein
VTPPGTRNMATEAREQLAEHFRHLGAQGSTLREILRELISSPAQLVATNAAAAPGVQTDFPIKGARRQVLERVAAQQANGVAVTAASGLVITENERRLGLSIVNAGGVGVTLSLGDGPATVHGGLWLAPAGSWDGLVSNVLWAGSVQAIADAGTSVLAVVEL